MTELGNDHPVAERKLSNTKNIGEMFYYVGRNRLDPTLRGLNQFQPEPTDETRRRVRRSASSEDDRELIARLRHRACCACQQGEDHPRMKMMASGSGDRDTCPR